jgi:hypothetical protein
MHWECSECGSLVERVRPPVKCDACGIAGAIFMPVRELSPDNVEDRELRELWLRTGMAWADAA